MVFEMFVYEGFADLHFHRVKWIMFGVLWGERVLELYGMVKWAGWWKPISIFLLEDVSEFLEGIGEFLLYFTDMLSNV